MHRGYLAIAAILGALAVALGAFGAHKLKTMVPPETVASFQTGVQYQIYHTFALIAVAIVYERFPGAWLRRAGLAFIIGIALFSGSLYLLTAMKSVNEVGLSGIGIITPIGGLFLIVGWVCLFIGIRRR